MVSMSFSEARGRRAPRWLWRAWGPRLSRRVVVALAVAMAVPAWAGDLPMSLVALSSPVPAFAVATVEIETGWFAVCQLVARGRTGFHRASGFADAAGRVSWRWPVGSPGLYGVLVTCTKGEDRGQLRASFNVLPRRPGR
jgi:hypothetical protein